jgi:membrane-associated phospholipid phosphatase
MAAQASTPTRKGPIGSSTAGFRRRGAAIHLPSAVPRPDRSGNGATTAARAGAPLGPALRFAGLEVLLWASLYGLYLAVRGLSIASTEEALANARSIVDAERAVGLFHEAGLQDSMGALEGVLSVYCVVGFAPLLAGVLAWFAIRNRRVYRELRSLLLISIALAVVVHVAVPVAPPRLVPELEIADTVGLDRDGASFAGIPYNPYAALPSMHVGWSLLVALLAFQASSALLVRAFFAVHPALMAVAVTATGNHYFLDSLAGAAVALTALGLWRLLSASRAVLVSDPQPGCAHC